MRLFLATFLLILAFEARAESVKVRAGDHPDFIRLMLTFDERPPWSVRQTRAGYDISFDSETSVVFDLADAFRLADDAGIELNANEDRLSVNFECACAAEFRNQGQNGLVVDIRVLEPDIVAPPMQEAPQQPDNPTGAISDIALPSADALFDRNAILDIAANPTFGEIDLPVRPDGFSEAVTSLGRELSRAAAQGLIEASPDPERRDGHALGPISTAIGDGRANISATTSLDREILPLRNVVPPTNMGATCFPDDQVDIDAWGNVSMLADLGRLRGAAMAEDGAILPEGALALARYYLALGFGAEAKSYAKLLPDGSHQSLLYALADIMDEVQTDSTVLDGQAFCNGKIALWAILARPITAAEAPTSTDDILATFSALPAHLRIHLGPTLAERLRSAGLDDDARIAVNAVTRGGAKTSESELVNARLGLSGTGHDIAQSVLEDLAHGSDATAAEALIELLEDARARGMPPNPDWVEDAPSLVRATIGTQASERLNISALRGRIALGQFDILRNELSEDMPGIDDVLRQTLAAEALVQAEKVAEPVAFLKTEVSLNYLSPQEVIDRTSRFKIAKRLTDLGLAERAIPYLPDDPMEMEEVLITADVLFATGAEMRAVALLESRPEDVARKKLGLMLSRVGQDALAVPVFASSGQLDDAVDAAMRVGDWDWIASQETSVSEAARGLLSPVPDPGVTQPINGALVRSSQALRAHAKSLLGEQESGAAFTN